MDELNSGFNPLMEILQAISNIDLDDVDDLERLNNDDITFIDRGPPNNMRGEIQNQLKINQRKKAMIRKVEALKDIIQQKNETEGIRIMASLINEILSPIQKKCFKDMLDESYEDDLHLLNPDYVPSCSEFSNYDSNPSNFELTARGGLPINSITRDAILDSLSAAGEEEAVKLPLVSRYNPSEVYLVQKGIHYCRILLAKYNSANDNTILKELKEKELLQVVLHENINNEKNYIFTLANNFPKSFDEIKFIILVDKDLILRSTIFVNIAQRNIQNLYDFLVKLSTFVDKNELSRACDHSQCDGVCVAQIISQVNSIEMRSYADKILRFLNRHKQGQMF